MATIELDKDTAGVLERDRDGAADEIALKEDNKDMDDVASIELDKFFEVDVDEDFSDEAERDFPMELMEVLEDTTVEF